MLTLTCQWPVIFLLVSVLVFTFLFLKYFSLSKGIRSEKEKSDAKFMTIFNSTSDEIYLIDTSGRFLESNRVLTEVLGYTDNEMKSLQIKDILPDKYADMIEYLLNNVNNKEVITEAEHLTKEGRIYAVEIKSKLVTYGGTKAILNIARDMSERKQTEKKILNAIIETEQRERERVAKDLHDQLGNILSSMNIYFQLIKSSTIDEAERENLMGYFKGLINEAIESTKEIANNLNPNVISKFGIIQALQIFCDKINKTGIIRIYLTTNLSDQQMEKETEVNLYKIITELTNNTLKHASSDRIYIALSAENKLLNMNYEDNGIGFDYDEMVKDNSNRGMGLSNIASRVAAIGGTMKVVSRKMTGTRVNIQANIS